MRVIEIHKASANRLIHLGLKFILRAFCWTGYKLCNQPRRVRTGESTRWRYPAPPGAGWWLGPSKYREMLRAGYNRSVRRDRTEWMRKEHVPLCRRKESNNWDNRAAARFYCMWQRTERSAQSYTVCKDEKWSKTVQCAGRLSTWSTNPTKACFSTFSTSGYLWTNMKQEMPIKLLTTCELSCIQYLEKYHGIRCMLLAETSASSPPTELPQYSGPNISY
jgi:hypothetical protein